MSQSSSANFLCPSFGFPVIPQDSTSLIASVEFHANDYTELIYNSSPGQTFVDHREEERINGFQMMIPGETPHVAHK